MEIEGLEELEIRAIVREKNGRYRTIKVNVSPGSPFGQTLLPHVEEELELVREEQP